MILADTSVWVDHFRSGNERLQNLLDHGDVLIHAFVIGELMLGGVPGDMLVYLRALPLAAQADSGEVEALVESASLAGRGIGYGDAALLASVLLDRTQLWTLDRRLATVADHLSAGMGSGRR
jgi:predicted nucleic acid-binding protein